MIGLYLSFKDTTTVFFFFFNPLPIPNSLWTFWSTLSVLHVASLPDFTYFGVHVVGSHCASNSPNDHYLLTRFCCQYAYWRIRSVCPLLRWTLRFCFWVLCFDSSFPSADPQLLSSTLFDLFPVLISESNFRLTERSRGWQRISIWSLIAPLNWLCWYRALVIDELNISVS